MHALTCNVPELERQKNPGLEKPKVATLTPPHWLTIQHTLKVLIYKSNTLCILNVCSVSITCTLLGRIGWMLLLTYNFIPALTSHTYAPEISASELE